MRSRCDKIVEKTGEGGKGWGWVGSFYKAPENDFYGLAEWPHFRPTTTHSLARRRNHLAILRWLLLGLKAIKLLRLFKRFTQVDKPLLRWLSQFTGKFAWKIVEFSASSCQVVDLQTSSCCACKLLTVSGQDDLSCSQRPFFFQWSLLLLLYCSLGRTYFHNDIWGLRASLEPGLGNYATDLVRGAAAARGVKLSEVEPDSEAVWASLSLPLSFSPSLSPAVAKRFRQIFW